MQWFYSKTIQNERIVHQGQRDPIRKLKIGF
jgi:hypothetical protein